MKVLVIGQGGREHALCWKLRQSALLSKLYCAPGNPGTAGVAENVPIAVHETGRQVDFARKTGIDFTIVGPELPLTLGVADEFERAGLRIFGPSAAAARIEGSKSFAKEVLNSAVVPTAGHWVFDESEKLRAWLAQHPAPIVLKADGLAAGKGVFVCHSRAEAEAAAAELFGRLGAARVVAEEYLSGREASYIVAVAGGRILPLAAAHDYKRVGDGDQGPNTGGMGSVSPTPNLSSQQQDWVIRNVMRPVLRELQRRGIFYRGFLYAGLMIDAAGSIKVLEFNARLGDPETQVILPRLQGDLLELLYELSSVDPASTEEHTVSARWSEQAAVCVVLAAPGYPDAPSTGAEISGLQQAGQMAGVQVFHAGTAGSHDRCVTAGGRVLNVTALGSDIAAARDRVYAAVATIEFADRVFRRDIGLPPD